jgi:hypothetical protein
MALSNLGVGEGKREKGKEAKKGENEEGHLNSEVCHQAHTNGRG